MNLFNINLCHSIKNKNTTHIQCSNKPKNNEVLCGKHLISKNIILFNDVNVIAMNNNIIPMNNNAIAIENNDDSKTIYTKYELFEKISNNTNISIYSIRKSIKNCILKNTIDTKQSKQLLIKCLKNEIEKERYYLTHVDSIILLQSFFRKFLIHRRALCANDTDILTFESKYDIPGKFIYIFFNEINNKKYAYDIRTLLEIIQSEYPSCPYTFRTFTDNEKDKILSYKHKLISQGIDICIEKKILTPEEEIEMKIKDIFYEINMLDNYTNHAWFKNLSLYQLTELYVKLEDIWNYRSNMDIDSKKKIIYNGIAFNIPLHLIKNIKSKFKLQEIILDEFKRFITEGINRDERKLGAILILTGLVEVSYEAADALPHLIQI
jgi:hypothetical protein